MKTFYKKILSILIAAVMLLIPITHVFAIQQGEIAPSASHTHVYTIHSSVCVFTPLSAVRHQVLETPTLNCSVSECEAYITNGDSVTYREYHNFNEKKYTGENYHVEPQLHKAAYYDRCVQCKYVDKTSIDWDTYFCPGGSSGRPCIVPESFELVLEIR